jgi:hypothetical protein
MIDLAELPLLPIRTTGNARASDVPDFVQLVSSMRHRVVASQDLNLGADAGWEDRLYVLSSGDELKLASVPGGLKLEMKARLVLGRPDMLMTVECPNPFRGQRDRDHRFVDAQEAIGSILRAAHLGLIADLVPDHLIDERLRLRNERTQAIAMLMMETIKPPYEVPVEGCSVSPPGPFDDDIRLHVTTDGMDGSVRLGRTHHAWMPLRAIGIGITTRTGGGLLVNVNDTYGGSFELPTDPIARLRRLSESTVILPDAPTPVMGPDAWDAVF